MAGGDELGIGLLLLLLAKGKGGGSSSSGGGGGNAGGGGGAAGGGGGTVQDVTKVVGAGIGIAGTVAAGLKGAGLIGGTAGAGGATTVAGGGAAGGASGGGATAAGGTAAGGGGSAGAADTVPVVAFDVAELLNPALIAVEVLALYIILSMIAYDLTTGFHTWLFKMGKFLGLGISDLLDTDANGKTIYVPNPAQRGYAHFRANRVSVSMLEQVAHANNNDWPMRNQLPEAADYSWRTYVDGQWLGSLEGPLTLSWPYGEPAFGKDSKGNPVVDHNATTFVALLCHFFGVHYAWWAARYEQVFLANKGNQPLRPPYLDKQELWDRTMPIGGVPAMSWVDFNNFLARNVWVTLAQKQAYAYLTRRLQFMALCDGVFNNLKGDPDQPFPFNAWDWAQKRFTYLGLINDDCSLILDGNEPLIQFGPSWWLHGVESSAGFVWATPGAVPPPGQVAYTSVRIIDAKDGKPYVRSAG
jgi:hypothetical protein